MLTLWLAHSQKLACTRTPLQSHEEFDDDQDYAYMDSTFRSLVVCIGTTLLGFFLRGFKFLVPFFPNDSWRFRQCCVESVLDIMANRLFDNVEVESPNRRRAVQSHAPTRRLLRRYLHDLPPSGLLHRGTVWSRWLDRGPQPLEWKGLSPHVRRNPGVLGIHLGLP
jgi:hypothetical protein